jgi:alpha-1,6-mannosyltransferase
LGGEEDLGTRLPTADRRLRGDGRTLKLVDLTEFYSPLGGGVRSYLTAKARWLASQPNIDHVILVSGGRDGVNEVHRSRLVQIKGPPIPASPGYHFMTSTRRISRMVRELRPDVIEVGSPYAAPWIAGRAARNTSTKLVSVHHSDIPTVIAGHFLERAPHAVQAGTAAALTRYLARAFRSFDACVVASNAAQDTLEQSGLPRVVRIPLGTDIECFHPDRRDVRWREEVGAAADQPIALYVGRLAPEKELEFALSVLPDVHAKTGIRLVMIGEGHLRSRFEALAHAYPNWLTVLPFESNPDRLARAYASADLFLAPCPFETFGLAAVEAMASGLSVVGVAQGGIGELLEHATWGRSYRRGDRAGLARAATEVLKAGPRTLGRAARRVAEQHYSWERTFGTLAKLYRDLVGS